MIFSASYIGEEKSTAKIILALIHDEPHISNVSHPQTVYIISSRAVFKIKNILAVYDGTKFL